MEWLYRIGIGAYHRGIRLADRLGNQRARQWVEGRKLNTSEKLAALRSTNRPIVWLHAASLGEFEQGRPVLELLKGQNPELAIVVTFFSPSGYERCKNSDLADLVAYLPADSPTRARAWVKALQPTVAIFVKYEFWYFHLQALREAGVPTYLIAGVFRNDQPFFRWYGGWWRRSVLNSFTHFGVQTEKDRALLVAHGFDKVTVTGDPRMDRTLELAEAPFEDERLASFTDDHPTLFAGSVWPPDVQVLAEALPALPDNWRLVLAPHQLKADEIADWQSHFDAELYSGSPDGKRVMILDTIGILSRSYRYAKLAYIGGAFGSGLHNTLEPMSYGLPVIFGPRYHKFPEAVEAAARGGAFSIESGEDLKQVLQVLTDEEGYTAAKQQQRAYTQENRGAAKRTAFLIARVLIFFLLSFQLSAQSTPETQRLVKTMDGLYKKCNLMVAISGMQWRSGLCVSAASLQLGQTVSLAVYLESGQEYTFVASAEEGINDIDLSLRNEEGELLIADTEDDATPIVNRRIERTGRYTLQIHAVSGILPRGFVALGILTAPGTVFLDKSYREVITQFGGAAGAVFAVSDAIGFNIADNSWCLYGCLLGQDQGTTLTNLRLDQANYIFAAAGNSSFQNIDLYLANADLQIVRDDRDPDPFPFLKYENREEGSYDLRIEVEKARSGGLVLLGVFRN